MVQQLDLGYLQDTGSETDQNIYIYNIIRSPCLITGVQKVDHISLFWGEGEQKLNQMS